MWGDPDDYEDWWKAVGISDHELYMQVHGLSLFEMHPEAYATRLVEAKPLEKYRVWMRFADGTERTAGFGDVAGRGVLRQWEDPGVWEGMRMSDVAVEWGPDDRPWCWIFVPKCFTSGCRVLVGKNYGRPVLPGRRRRDRIVW